MSNWNDRINKIKKECKISYPFKGEAMVGYFAGLDDMHTHIQSQLPIIIREIVQEAIKHNKTNPIELSQANKITQSSQSTEYVMGWNDRGSEILSNVEEMIK